MKARATEPTETDRRTDDDLLGRRDFVQQPRPSHIVGDAHGHIMLQIILPTSIIYFLQCYYSANTSDITYITE